MNLKADSLRRTTKSTDPWSKQKKEDNTNPKNKKWSVEYYNTLQGNTEYYKGILKKPILH